MKSGVQDKKFALVLFGTDDAGAAALAQRSQQIGECTVTIAKSKKEKLAEQFGGEAAHPSLSDADLELRLQGNFLDFKGKCS